MKTVRNSKNSGEIAKAEVNVRVLERISRYRCVPPRSESGQQFQSSLEAEIYDLTKPYIKKAIFEMQGVSTAIKEDCYSEAYFWLRSCIVSFKAQEKNTNFINYLIRDLKNKIFRYNKHNKNSFFTRDKTVKIVSLNQEEYDFTETIEDPRDAFPETILVTLKSRFSVEENITIGLILESVLEGVGRRELFEIYDDHFLVEWTLFKLREIYEGMNSNEFTRCD